MNMTPQDFVSKWKRSAAREKQSVQEHFLDLCNLVGHPTPIEDDPSGTRFAFEMGATKSGGGQGWADVAKLGYFGWEYKGKDSRDLDLNKAYQQLLRYRDALKNPPLLIVSDINTIIIRTNYTNLPTRTITLTLDDLLLPESLKTLRAVFFNPDELKPHQTVEGVTEAAAEQFSRLAGILRKYGEDNQRVAHFLIRLLFCLFAEDVGLLPERLFPRLLEQTRHRSKDFMEVLRQLFRAMNTGGFFGADRILFFNGGLFDSDYVLELDGDGMDILAQIDALDWGAIEPSIFGTLFERGLDPSKRSQYGQHYTGKDDILLIVEPVLMAPLRREWKTLKAEVEKMKAETEGMGEKKKAVIIKLIGAKLRLFADRIAAVQVLDPACGSGNFLYVALRLLLDLQNEVISLSDQLGAGRFFISVSPAQLHGIEINEYAHELAQITIWIGYIQWLVDNGYGLPAEPILKPLHTILQMDAILAYDETGRPMEPEWPAADVIVGNPPFLGDKKMREELGAEYINQLRELYEGRIPGGADLVTYWFEKARANIQEGKTKRAGLLATNSIRSGANRKVLDRIKSSGDIFMAWSDRPWILDGAAVRVSMVGFDNGAEKERFVDGVNQTSINADLTSHVNVTIAGALPENAGVCFLGIMKAGPFDIDSETAKRLLTAPQNPNGKPNSDVIKRRLGGQDVVQATRDVWIIDFIDMPVEQAALYELPFEYVRKHVKPLRDVNRDNALRIKWWLHGRSRPELRSALSGKKRCIVTPEVAKYRIFIWMDTSIIPDHKLHVIARDDDYFFGVLQSHLHEVWTLAQCSWMGVGNDPSYSSSRTFETFPFPWPPGKEPKDDSRVQAIAAAAKELVEMRDRWLNAAGLTEADRKIRTLTNLYNARPTWLDLAHKKLDAAVCDAYGWPHDLTDEQILERLLALNLQRAGRPAQEDGDHS
jgi:type II restriction/modification system DNA methylase subunit YeeA